MKMNARIYVMRAEDGTLKLGHSRNPTARAKQIGRPVEIVHQTDVIEHVEKIERLAHRVLALHGKHIRGEWFEAKIEDAIKSIETAVRQAEGKEPVVGGKMNTEGMGRPPSSNPHSALLHIRVTPDIVEWLDRIAENRLDQPSQAALVREALAEFIERHRGGTSPKRFSPNKGPCNG